MDCTPTSNEPSQGELIFWQSIKDSNDGADFVSYLNKFPNGFFRDLAANRLVTLRPNTGSVQPDPPTAPAITLPAVDEGSNAAPSKRGNRPEGVYRLQLVYWLMAALVIAVVTVQAGGDDEVSGWERLTNPYIVYWANDRGMPDILTNQYWLPASLTNEEAKAKLVTEGKVSRTESVIPLFIYTWNDFAAWPVMQWGVAIAFGIWLFGMLVVWIVSGFRQRA